MKQITVTRDRTLSIVRRARKDYACSAEGFCLGTGYIVVGEEYVLHSIPPGHDTFNNATWLRNRFCGQCVSILDVREAQEKIQQQRTPSVPVQVAIQAVVSSSRDEKWEWTREDLVAEAERRFGREIMDWKFICPNCSDIASYADFKAVGAEPGTLGQECIGRSLGVARRRGCDWTAYGLFSGPWTVILPAEDDRPECRVPCFRLAPRVIEQVPAA